MEVRLQIFEPIGPGIWTHESLYRLGALSIPHRVTVLRDPSGGLVVHSPARLDDETRASLEELGRVSTIVWPSWWHDLGIPEWMKAYPDARVWVAPDSRRAVRNKPGVQVLSETAVVNADLAQVYVDGLLAWFNEFVFFHSPSKTLIVADLIVNVHRDLPQPTRTFFSLLGAFPGPRIPWYYPLVSRDRRRLRDACTRILAWDFDAMVVGHGDVITTGAHAAFAEAVETLMPQHR